ncbi:PAS domain S-box protein [Rhizobium leguminosarum]|uniref:PAS domain S-box protein n=1 Tax=Rhizobium leguminosarum TaxID=384 RepID=UPI001C944CDA|nr:PAS domain S-box protein [Rhizobium leguminosarum]MBY5447161.1 PAS domain S-box protein [Rhizobium leguminosarum]
MDTTTGLRMLRALSFDADRDRIADALVAACLQQVGVTSAEVVFPSGEHSALGVPSETMSELRRNQRSVLTTTASRADAASFFVPLFFGDRLLAILKLEIAGHRADDDLYRENFETLTAFAALRIERIAVQADLDHARERARLAERELRLSWDMLPAHAWHTRPDGTLEAVNREWSGYFGLTEEESSGFGYTRVFHPDDLQKVMDVWTRSLSQEVPGEVETRMMRADGEARVFLIRTVPIRDENGKVIRWYGINIDVEDLKDAEREIARTAAALAEGQKMSRTGSWSWRPGTNSFSWSDECARIFGMDPNERQPSFAAMLERVHPDDRTAIEPTDASPDSSPEATQNEMRIVVPDGTIAFVESRTRIVRDPAGTVVEYVGTVRDITESKLAQDRIQESERRYAATLSSIGDAVISTDDKGRLMFINPVAEKLTGWTQIDAAERPVADVFQLIGETRQLVDDPVSEVLAREVDPLIGIQYALRSRAGSELIIDVSGAPIIDSRGDMKGAVLVFRDMTQRNETADALRRSKEDLARMSRLTAIGELAVSVAHEMNQPLMAIVTNAAASMSWLEGKSPNIEEATQAIGWVLRDGHRAGEVLSGILALARNSRPKIEPLNVREVIEEVLQLTKSELRQRGVVVETVYDNAADAVTGDRIQLQQVLINLVMNGAEAMTPLEDGRVLHVATRRSSDGLTQVSVSDNGIGLDPDTADRAFEAFFTTKATGIGMGLSICRSIIEAHGGHIWVATEKGTGSTFRFTLPPPPSLQERSATPEE